MTQSPSIDYSWLLHPSNPLQPPLKLTLFGAPLENSSSMVNPRSPAFDPLHSSLGTLSQVFSEADKAAKKRKLEEIRAEARRLEAEIAASWYALYSPTFGEA